MKCEEVQQYLSARLDGEVDQPLAWQIERHLRECRICREKAHQYERLEQAVRAVPVEEPHPTYWLDLRNKLSDRFPSAPSATRNAAWPSWFPPPGVAWRVAGVAAGVLVIVVSWIVWRRAETDLLLPSAPIHEVEDAKSFENRAHPGTTAQASAIRVPSVEELAASRREGSSRGSPRRSRVAREEAAPLSYSLSEPANPAKLVPRAEKKALPQSASHEPTKVTALVPEGTQETDNETLSAAAIAPVVNLHPSSPGRRRTGIGQIRTAAVVDTTRMKGTSAGPLAASREVRSRPMGCTSLAAQHTFQARADSLLGVLRRTLGASDTLDAWTAVDEALRLANRDSAIERESGLLSTAVEYLGVELQSAGEGKVVELQSFHKLLVKHRAILEEAWGREGYQEHLRNIRAALEQHDQ